VAIQPYPSAGLLVCVIVYTSLPIALLGELHTVSTYGSPLCPTSAHPLSLSQRPSIPPFGSLFHGLLPRSAISVSAQVPPGYDGNTVLLHPYMLRFCYWYFVYSTAGTRCCCLLYFVCIYLLLPVRLCDEVLAVSRYPHYSTLSRSLCTLAAETLPLYGLVQLSTEPRQSQDRLQNQDRTGTEQYKLQNHRRTTAGKTTAESLQNHCRTTS
jgi:hypothetical protein